MGIDLFPIRRYATSVECQQVRSQMRHLNPWQNQESTLIGDQMEIVFAGGYIPPDKSIAGSDVPRGGRPHQTSDRPAMGKGYILEVLSDRLGVTQVVVLVNQTVTELFLRSPADLLEVDGKKCIDGAMDRCLINRDSVGWFAVGQGIGKLAFGRRQLNPPLGFEEQQQAAAHHIFEGAIGLPPIPCPAKLLRDKPPAPAGIGGNDPPDNGDIRFIDNPTAVCDNGFHDV